jgi:hypothetical protein
MRIAASFVLIALVSNTAEASPITNPLPEGGSLDAILPDYRDEPISEDPKKQFHKMSPNYDMAANPVKLHSTSSSPSSSASSSPASNRHRDENIHCVDYEATEFKLRWATTVGSAVYATPVIFPGDDNNKHIFVV